jgi:hypothetical protein
MTTLQTLDGLPVNMVVLLTLGFALLVFSLIGLALVGLLGLRISAHL